jgi:hypothetical protein
VQGEAAEWELWQQHPLFPENEPPEGQRGAEQPRVTGGDTSVEWGTGGVWAEPFSLQDARQTLRSLFDHWNRQGLKGGRSTSGEAPAADNEGMPDGADGPAAGQPGGNGVCAHPACSAQVTAATCNF